MLTAVSVAQGNVVTEGLNAWFDFGNTECFNPTLYTGSITAGTIFNNLAPEQSAVSGTINGAVNWSTAFGGCMNLTNRDTSTLQYTAGLSASFTVQTIITPGTDALPNNNWISDAGGWPTLRVNNGLIWAQQQFPTGTNYLIPVLYAGASAGTLPAGTQQPASGWTEYMRFPNVYTFSTNGSNLHNTYTNNILKGTDTTTRTRGNSSVGTIYLNFDNAVGNRHGLGRIVAYLHYNRQLSDAEIYQNVQFYLNRIGTK
jgi:hypothetical protein